MHTLIMRLFLHTNLNIGDFGTCYCVPQPCFLRDHFTEFSVGVCAMDYAGSWLTLNFCLLSFLYTQDIADCTVSAVFVAIC